MPPPFTDQDPLDQEIDRFLSTLPPPAAPRAQPAPDPVDREIDDFLATLGPAPPAALRDPITLDRERTLRPPPVTIDVDRTLGRKAPTRAPSAILPPLATPEPSFGAKLAAAPGEAAKAALTSFVHTQTEPAIAAASMVYPGSAGTFQAVRQHEQENPVLPLADTGELAVTDPRWWAQMAGQAGGSAAGLLTASKVGGAAGFSALGKAGLASVPEALAEAGSVFNDVLGQTGDQRQAFAKATDVYAANMALLGLTNTPLFGEGGALLRRTLTGAAIEGGQEVGQQALSNVATGRPALEGAGESAVAGALAGGAFRAAERPARPPVRLAQDTRSEAPASTGMPPPVDASQGSQAAPAIDPVDEQIDAFLGALPPLVSKQEKLAPEQVAPPARGSLEAAIVDQFGGQITNDQVEQLAAQARADDMSSRPEIKDRARRNVGRSFEEFVGAEAVAQGYRGTAEEATAEVVRRARELHDAEQGSAAERTPTALLETIRDAGGIHVTDADLGGELRRLKEFKDPRTVNQIGGVQGVFRRGGHTLDDMAVELSRERGWTDINTPAALVDAIENAAIAAREGRAELPKFDVEHYAMGAGVKPGSRWWVQKTVPRNPKLTGNDAAVQERAARALEDDFEGFRTRYTEQFGTELNADNASELFDDYAKSKETRSTLVRAVRAPAAALVEDLYQRKLEEPTPEGKSGVVMFTGGGNGSGKSSAIDPEDKAGADIVFDSTMSEFEATRKKIDAALDSGRFVELRYVYRDPVMAFERGVLPRAVKTGRTVPIPTHVNTHIGSLRTIQQLADHYAAEPGVGIEVFEAKEGPTAKSRFELEPTTLDALAAKEYPDPHGLRAQLQAVLERANVPAAIRQGTDLSPRAPGAGDTERAAGFAPGRGGLGSGAERSDAGSGPGDAGRAGLPETLSESRAPSGRARVPVPLKSASSTHASGPAKLRADLDEGLGSPTRRVFEEGPEAVSGAKPPKAPISESQAVARLQTIFGHDKPPTALERMGLRTRQRTPLPTKTGRFRERAFGVYKIEPQVIRLKRFGDLATFTHELGHHIDFGVFGEANRPGGALFADELLRLGANTSPSGAPKNVRMAEGVAEFFRLYFPNPDRARQAAPQFFRALEEMLAANPAMARQFAEGQQVVQSYLAQDLATRGAARVDRSRREVDEDPRTLTQRLEVQWVDDLADLRRAVETLSEDGPVPYKQNAYVLARLARGAAGKASGFLEFGPRRDDGTFLGRSFADAIAPVRGRLKEFSEYLVASRVPELRGRGIETGMTVREAEAIRDKYGSPEFEQARDALYAYQNAVLEYAVQGGALSRQLADKIKLLNQHYVPFHRLLSSDVRPGVARRIADRTLPIKKIRGSGADIIDPLESIIKNTHAIVDMVEKNKAMRALVKQATSTTGGGQFIEAIPQPKVATKFNLDQLRGTIRDVLRDANLAVRSVRDAEGDYIEVEGQAVNLDEFVTVFTPAAFSMPGQDLVTVIDGGKRSFYAVNDKALYQAITQMGAKPASIVVALLGAPARALRAGATLTLGFIGRNPVRDTFAATVQSKYGFKPGVDTLRGLFHYLKKDEQYQQFLNSGAAGAALVSGDRKVLQRELRKYAAEGKLTDHLQDVVAHPIDALRALSEATEVATRLGEFMKATAKEGRTEEGFARAGLAARDITVDFSRAGTEGRTWNQYAAFLNARIQGYARLAETFRTDPVGATIRATTAITLLSIAAWALNHDDDEWRELPEWEKATYWHIPIGWRLAEALKVVDAGVTRGHSGWLRIPKPFELGAVFGTFFEKALDHVTAEDPHAFKRLFMDDPNGDAAKLPLQAVKNGAWSVIQAITPTAILPILEVQANYSTFRDRAIVSPFDADLEPALQYNRWTSETAKVIGKALDYPPAKIDHLIYGYGAGLARGVVGGVEGAAKRVMGGVAAPSARASDLPGVGAFVRDVAGSDAESLTEFQRRREALEGAARSAKRYKEQGDAGELARLRSKFPTIDADRRRFRQAAEELKDLRDQVDAAFKDTKLESDAKRERLDRLYERMVNTARVTLGKKPLPSRFSGAALPTARR